MVQTKDGYLWLIAQGSLVRFDGIRLKPFNTGNTPEYRLRVRSLRMRQKALARQVEERTAELREEQRRLVLANRELEAFSYSVSHDLRGPVETINSYVYLILTAPGAAFDLKIRELLLQIQNASRRMAELIDDLLNLSRLTTTAMHMGPVALSAMARTVMQDLQRRDPARNVDVVIRDCADGKGDARWLQIVLENLLGNAWKYTSGRENARIEFGCERREDADVFFVRDNGVGFDPAQAERLFKPFQRLHSASKFPGTGIGLATVQRIIQRHGGDIWAESKVDGGATFYFTIEPHHEREDASAARDLRRVS